ncbi:MAG: stage V sporulation protein AD [Bacilli bacterium]|nr:stage V sporulation protein AD [Bacilli bacterium]
MTFTFHNVYMEEVSTVCGPYEKKGPLKDYFDKSYKDFYCGEKTFEKAEVKMVRDALLMMMKKTGMEEKDFDLVVGTDLLNQITASTYGAFNIGNSFIGVYGACSGSSLSMIVASCLIEGGFIKNSLCFVSSHNMTSEKQFRYPTEYGAPRPNTATFTATGCACCLLSREKSSVRIESATLGRIMDYSQNDPNDMGRVMGPSAVDTFVHHFEETGRTPDYYDLILTGDLGIYGKEIVKDYMKKTFHIDLGDSYNDCGVMLYDLNHQKEVKAGGSGPACSGLVLYSYVYQLLKTKKIKRVLFLATGALFSPLFLYQKQNIPSICHAVSLEAV